MAVIRQLSIKTSATAQEATTYDIGSTATNVKFTPNSSASSTWTNGTATTVDNALNYLKSKLVNISVQTGTKSSKGTGGWISYGIDFNPTFKSTPLVSVMHTNGTSTENIYVSAVSALSMTYLVYGSTSSWTFNTRWMAIGLTS